MTSRWLAQGCFVLGAVGCIPYYDFTPCEETGTCNRFDATERGEPGDLAPELPGDTLSDALDASEGAATDVPDADADAGEDDGARGADVAGDVDDAPEDVACAEGTGDCDGLPTNGCEADTRTSATHCGACGVACAAPEHGAARCTAGRCEVTCDAGHVRDGESCAPIAAPRLVAPLSPHTVTSQTPRLRWALGAGSDGARVELCRERACATVVHRFDAAGTSAVTPMTLTPGAWFWRAVGMQGAAAGVAYSATWELFVGHRSAPVNTAWGQTTDLNGDGYADLVFAAGSTIYVYAGSPRGLATTPSMLTPVPGQEVRGLSARGGDVDGDGFGDLLVHVVAPGEVLGVALLYRGGAGGVGGTAARTYDPVATSASLLGDTNGDGFGDIALNEALLLGSSTLPSDTRVTPPVSDRVLTTMADLNGDGLADFADCLFSRLRATCQAMAGASSGSPSPYGGSLETLGGASSLYDVDGDGRADMAAIVRGAKQLEQTVFYGGASTRTRQLLDALLVPTGIGDINRDGLSDALLYLSNTSGAFQGMSVAFGRVDRSWSSRLPLSTSAGVGFASASSYGPVGDTDGDGVADFFIVDEAARTLFVFGSGVAVTGLPDRRIAPPATPLVLAR
jgi:hypothetical protein